MLLFVALHKSAYGTKRTWPSAPHMSALRGKADMAICTAECPLMTQRDIAVARTNARFRGKAEIANGGRVPMTRLWFGAGNAGGRCTWRRSCNRTTRSD